MSTNLFFRISTPYSWIASRLATIFMKCQEYAVVEHEADEDIKRTHCHILIGGYSECRETLRKNLNEIKYENLSGNSLKSIKNWEDPQEIKTLVYMLKGNLHFQVCHGFERFWLKAHANGFMDLTQYVWSLWVEHDANSASKILYEKCFATFLPPLIREEELEFLEIPEWEEKKNRLMKVLPAHVRKFAFKECGGYWSYKFENMCKMLQNTYLMNAGFW